MAASRERVGSLQNPLSEIHLPSCPTRLRSEAEEPEVTVLASESEAALEEEVKVDDRWRFFRPCRWINLPFMRLSVLVEEVVAVVAAALETEDGCVPGGAVVGGEVNSGGLCHRNHISIVWRSGSYAVTCFRMPARTEGTAYSVVGGGVLCQWRRQSRKGKLPQIESKCNE